MTVDASRSGLGLGTCVGSTTRQIVVARVLLTATVPPALPGSSMSGNSLAPPLDKLTRWLRSARRRRYAPGDGPNKAGQLAGDRDSDDIGRLAGSGELAVAGTEPKLPLPGDLTDRPKLRLLPQLQLAADPRRKTVTLGRLDQQPAGRAIAGLGEAAAFDAGTARMLGARQPR